MSKKYSFGLIGYPLSHSLSPGLHQAALEAAGLEGEYRLYPIPPLSAERGVGGEGNRELKELLGGMRVGAIHGLNVTIPHKQTVIPYLDELTPTAQAIGAVNTIYRSADFNRLVGDNTDAPGFLADLKQFFKRIPYSVFRKEALILGAGGSARAVVYALLQDDWHVTIAARRIEQAEALANDFSQIRKPASQHTDQQIRNPPIPPSPNSSIPHYPLPTLPYPLTQLPNSPITLLLNTTPLGMTPNPDTSPWPIALPFPENAAVYDLVYNPRETKLVRDARAAGLPATTGLGMLIEQAARAFEIWTGRNVDREAMRDAVA